MSELMFNTLILSIAPLCICILVAVFVWLRVKSSRKLDKQGAELHDQQTAAFLTQVGDLASAVVNVAIGILLGVALYGLIQLVFAGAWVAVFSLVALAAGLLFIVLLHERLGNWLFPSGIRPAHKPKKPRKKPLVRRLALPAGLVLGLLLAAFELDDRLLGWLL